MRIEVIIQPTTYYDEPQLSDDERLPNEGTDRYNRFQYMHQVYGRSKDTCEKDHPKRTQTIYA